MDMNYDEAKSSINLVLFLENQGFWVDLDESSKEDYKSLKADTAKKSKTSYHYICRKGNLSGKKSRDKIGVSLNPDGRWLYVDNRGHGHGKGSIIDWVINHVDNVSGPREALKYLEKKELLESKGDLGEVSNFMNCNEARKFEVACANVYLMCRGITKETQSHARFLGKLFQDSIKNLIIPHFDEEKQTGYAIKNKGYQSFSSKGKRSLWRSNFFESDQVLVLCESAIDCLAHFQYFKCANTRYVSIEGTLSRHQIDLLKKEILSLGSTAEIHLCFDDDHKGNDYEEIFFREISCLERKIVRVIPPFGFKDFGEIYSA